MPVHRMGRISKYRQPIPRLVTPTKKILEEKVLFMFNVYQPLLCGLVACSGAGGEDLRDHGKDVRYIGAHEQENDCKEQYDEADLSNVNIEARDFEPASDLPTFMDLDLDGELDLLVQTHGDDDDATGIEAFTFGQVPIDYQPLSQFSVCHLVITKEWIGDEDKCSSPQPAADAAIVQEPSDILETQDASDIDEVPDLIDDKDDFGEETEDASMDDFTDRALRRFRAAFSEASAGGDKSDVEQDLDAYLASEGVDTAFFSSSTLFSLVD